MTRSPKPVVTRTHNPLPFDQMEPKRFEDMARQLAYDFKPWRQLEATGRSGGDGGFDARGFEMVLTQSQTVDLTPEDEALPETATDRLWLIQCKRERKIGPTLALKHLDAIAEGSRKQLHGLLFVAACDFSLETRNVIRDWCRINSVVECIIWGRGELEDLLFQPKNDGLLFAYFGISLRITRQRIATDLRREIALKRKLKRLIPNNSGNTVILRDPSDSRYPVVEGNSLKESKCLWLPRQCLGIGTYGVRIVVREFWAFYEWHSHRWDIASAVDNSIPNEQENPWFSFQAESGRDELVERIVDLWQQFPRGNQCFIKIITYIPYDEIIEIDDVGDHNLEAPTIFLSFKNGLPPFAPAFRVFVDARGYDGVVEINPTKHAVVFADEMRNLNWEGRFFRDFGVERAVEPYPVTLSQPK